MTRPRRVLRRHPLPELLDPIQPRAGSRRVIARVVAETGLELFEQFLLLLAELHRRFDDDLADQVADMAVAYVAYALAAQFEHLAGLCLGGNLDRRFAAE